MLTNQPKETEKKHDDLMFSPGSERNILSICLKDSDKVIEVESKDVHPHHFAVKGNRFIFVAIAYLKQKNIKPTPMAILEVLSGNEAKEAVAELGGLDYLMLLEEAFVPSDTLNFFIDKVKQAHTRRMMFNIGSDIKDFVLSDKADTLNPSEIVGYAEQRIMDLNVNTQSHEEVYKMGTNAQVKLEQRAETPSQVPGLEVGWERYDKLTNGAIGGDLIIICAPSKTGKSVTLTNWATKISIIDQLPVLYIDTEMGSNEQEDRILANLSGVPFDEIISGMYVLDTAFGTAEEKCEALRRAREQLDMGNYFHIYMPHFSIEKVTALTRKFKMQFGIVALFFDYIKVPSSQADFKSIQEYQKLGFFTSGLKDLAGILDIPVFSACQTNRSDNKTDSPDESNIGGSYRILQLATKLMFLYNKTAEQIAKDGYDKGNQQLFIKWQRHGQSDCDPINIFFDKPIIRQVEAFN